MRRITVGRVRFALIVLFLASLGAPEGVWGQSPDPITQQTISSLVQQIKDLQQHDRKLEERIKILEANQKAETSNATSSSPALPVPAVPPSPEAQAAPEPLPSPPAATPEMHTLRGMQWRGFAEVDYQALNQKTNFGTYGFVPGSAGNFYVGDFDLFLSARLTNRTSVLSDLDFEEIDSQMFKIDVRRMLFKFDANDHFRLSLGRYQTTIGYYNWAFPSATFLQTTADRPLVMEFASNGGILPTQAVGVSVTGAIPSGGLGMNYIAEYGSSDTIRPDINGDGLFNDENNGNHISLGLFLTPDRFPGLRIGGSFYHDQISDLITTSLGGPDIGTQSGGDNFPPESARWNQTIVNGHVVYVSHGIEFLNEGFLIRHAPIGQGVIYNTPAFYSQFSKKIGLIRPFVRFQYINASDLNPIYNDVGLRYGPSLGARYDANDFWAFKAQLDRTIRDGAPAIDGLHLQLSGTF